MVHGEVPERLEEVTVGEEERVQVAGAKGVEQVAVEGRNAEGTAELLVLEETERDQEAEPEVIVARPSGSHIE